MHGSSVRTTVAALLTAISLLFGTTGHALAQNNNEQNGLVNVNIQDLDLQIPVAVALPIGLAANVCGVSAASLARGDNNCTAENNSTALSRAVAERMVGTDGGNGNGGNNQNRQSGLINVNVQDLDLQVPVAVALPIGVAANVCGVSILAIQEANNTCDAQNTSEGRALSRAIAQDLAAQ